MPSSADTGPNAESWRPALFTAAMILLVRPASVFLSSVGSGLGLREKLFLSWMAPRGIVAAAVASVFALRLQADGVVGAEKLVPGRGDALTTTAEIADGIAGTRAFIADMFGAAKKGVEAGHDLKQVYDDAYAILAPKYGDWVIFDHCIPFNLSRAFDEAGGTRDPRIWTAERDMEMWRALQA